MPRPSRRLFGRPSRFVKERAAGNLRIAILVETVIRGTAQGAGTRKQEEPRMKRTRAIALLAVAAVFAQTALAGTSAGKRFEWSTKSAEAKTLLLELQQKVENFQLGGQASI